MIGARYLSSDDVDDLATQWDFVKAVREAYRERGKGAPTHPRITLKSNSPKGVLNSYMAILPETGVMGGYMYTAGFEDGDARFVSPVFDAASGKPLAVVDGAYMNTYKTGAAGAVGIDALAREDANTIAVIGSGSQARGQLRGANTVRNIDEARVFSPTASHREEFAEAMTSALDVDVIPTESSTEAVTDADVVITATNASDPVIDDDDLAEGVHINAIGQYDPEKRELQSETVERAVYVADLRERALQDAGSFLLAKDEGVVDVDHIHAELGEVVAGVAAGRIMDDQVTVFDSGGTAIETLASAALLYRLAIAEDRGRKIGFVSASDVYEGKHGNTSEEL